ncbi:MAG: SIMPL domain-containing protein [Clostridia bacterium]|nr:SIMPL domain-containing protein [Clostridia bacterium]
MNKLLSIILALLMLTLPALAAAEGSLSAADAATLTVTGSAVVTLKADYARVSVGVNTRADTIDAATEQNGAAIRAVIAALAAAGVAEEDVATSNYSVYAEYDYSTGVAVQSGYNVSNQLTVILKDMTRIGAVLDEASKAGANTIHSIEFLSTSSSAAQDEAAGLAVQEAIRKANLLAAAAGLTVGGVISISESSTVVYAATQSFDSAKRSAASNVILPDDLSVTASVTMVFELK